MFYYLKFKWTVFSGRQVSTIEQLPDKVQLTEIHFIATFHGVFLYRILTQYKFVHNESFIQ
jgi:hypothetical protein